jgi:hypothetical protein
MKIEAIPDDLVESLLTETSGHVYEVPKQYGPLRQFDTAMRCACRGCGSSTFHKVNGVPRCMTHALRELNMIIHQAWPDKDWLK